MSTRPQQIEIAGIPVEVTYKEVKTIHIVVYPPDGNVRAIVPLYASDAQVQLAVAKRLAWILKERAAIAKTERQSAREMVHGESHYVLGKRHLLRVIKEGLGAEVFLDERNRLTLREGARSTLQSKREALDHFYRNALNSLVSPMCEEWALRLQVEYKSLAFKRMQTRWGSCDVSKGNIILNLELGKYAPAQIEYVVVHELIHLFVPGHGAAFQALLSQHLPDWRARLGLLNAGVHGPRDWR